MRKNLIVVFVVQRRSQTVANLRSTLSLFNCASEPGHGTLSDANGADESLPSPHQTLQSCKVVTLYTGRSGRTGPCRWPEDRASAREANKPLFVQSGSNIHPKHHVIRKFAELAVWVLSNGRIHGARSQNLGHEYDLSEPTFFRL